MLVEAPRAGAAVVDVLLVEDSDDDALLVRRGLDRNEFSVRRARSLAEAVLLLRAPAPPECVLLDLSLPDADELEGIERLQRVAPEVPIVVLTGNADESVGLEAVSVGAQDYLVKGRSTPDALQRAIRYAVERKHTTNQLAEVRERFRQAFDEGPLGIALLGVEKGDCRVLEANRSLSEIVGRTRDELVGTRIEDFTHWQDRAEQAHAVAAVLKGTTQRYSGDHRLIHSAGHVVWCTITASTVRSASGDLLYAIALVDDVTDRRLQEEALREAHLAVDTAVLGIALVSLSGRCRTVNAFYARALGYEQHELVGAAWEATVHPEDHARMRAAVARVVTGESATVEVRAVRKDGTTFVKEIALVPNTGPDGALKGYFNFMRDVTENREAQQAIEASEARYRRIIETANEGVALIDPDGCLSFVNAKLAEMFGYGIEEMLGRPATSFLDVGDQGRGQAMLERRRTGEPGRTEYRFRRKDGTELWGQVSTSPLLEDGTFVEALAMITDVTDRRRAEEDLRRLALRDQLTGLPNRVLLEDRLRVASRVAERRATFVGLLFIDLDRFKMVNDAYGHDIGDELIRLVVARLEGALRAADMLARFGGDEFVVLCEDLTTPVEAVAVADRLLATLAAPIELSVGRVAVTASIGVTMSGPAGGTPADLLRDADIAMYRAKENGGGRHELFDLSMRSEVVAEINLERDLREAVAGSELSLNYQPIVTLPDERVVGFEALLRWRHAERGFVSPADFIPLAERSGLILEIGRWVLREACRQLAAWTASADNDWARLAVNVSARQIDQPEFVEELRSLLQEFGVDGHQLELEITETALFSRDADVTAGTLKALGALGVGIVLDDFGTGYSSLSYLSRYQLTGMKLDRAFISSASSEGRRPIVEAVTAMAQSLGLSLVGEGVETVEQASLLTALGCEMAQGYLFGRPMEAAAIDGWMTSRKKHLAAGGAAFSGEAEAWMSLGEAADALGVSASTLRRWADEGRVAAHRTRGGHRRFAVADLKRLSAERWKPTVRLSPAPRQPLLALAALLDRDGQRVIAAVVRGLYENPRHGWFRSDRARRPLHQWVADVGRACRSGEYQQLDAATARLVRHAQVAGASTLECVLFMERFGAAVVKSLTPAGRDLPTDHADVARVAATLRHAVVAGH